MISPSEHSVPPVWADEPVTVEVAMRVFSRLSAEDIVRRLEDEGWEPGDLHRELARRAIAAASTFTEALEDARSRRGDRPRRRAPA